MAAERRHPFRRAFNDSGETSGGAYSDPLLYDVSSPLASAQYHRETHPDKDGSPLAYATRMPPREFRAMRERSRSVTPPPPLEPSPSYTALADQPPSRIDDPATSRKLLILDLNGTLLHRSPQQPRTRNRYIPEHERPRDEQGRLLPRLRPVHCRPYMGAFRQYLFAPETRAWLDTMVWSSAQPHSVADMVEKSFGEDKAQLLAIWARDTLGLPEEHYFRKVQTTKDLARPWSLLAPQSSHHASPSSSPPTSPPSSSPPRRDASPSPTQGSAQAHSALTTLLLDDSPRKAELQPHNHVCIGEYTGELRAKDVELLQREQDRQAVLAAREALESVQSAPSSLPPPQDAAESSAAEESAASDASETKRRKRKARKLAKRAARLEEIAEDGAAGGEGGGEGRGYEPSLLAIVGVLDAVKTQGNVAAWIRTGGLWGPDGPPAALERAGSPQLIVSTVADEEGAPEDDGARSDGSTLSVPGAQDKKRKRVQSTTSEDTATAAAAGNDAERAVSAMWFEHPDVVGYWAGRGRDALRELGIAVEPGIDR